MTAEPSPPSDTQRTSTRSELITREPAEALAGLLDIPLPSEDDVPALWHWIYLLDRPAQATLGPDGHPRDGIPAPPGPGLRRMFAGGRVTTHHPLRLGLPATRTKRVTRSEEKQGRTGPLTFVTARTEISQAGRMALVEEQDIVYRRPDKSLTVQPGRAAVEVDGELALDVDPTLLFRFSALTYNAHRIHYDRAYAVDEEGYPDLIVHGPLQVLMMSELLRRNGADFGDRTFAYRLVSPMLGAQRLTVLTDGSGLETKVLDSTGRVTATGVLRSPKDAGPDERTN